MTWIEIGRDHLTAAKRLSSDHPRSAVSRAYYAVHVVLSDAIVRAGYKLRVERQTVPHEAQPNLIGAHLSALGTHAVRELRRVVRRSQQRRIDADYRRTTTVDRTYAVRAIRDAGTVFAILGLEV